MEWTEYYLDYRTYEVSPCGKVRNEKGQILRGTLHKNGFLTINARLRNNGSTTNHCLSVHRMVAECYLKNTQLKPMVIHLDGNPLNNHVENLQWATAEEKITHQRKIGKLKSDAKLKAHDVIYIKNLLADGKLDNVAIGKIMGVSHTQIRRIKIGECWKNVNNN